MILPGSEWRIPTMTANDPVFEVLTKMVPKEPRK
jgi:hypothetical protein